MKKYLALLGPKALKVARNPVVRPVEVWALRAILGVIAVKLGIDLESLVQ